MRVRSAFLLFPAVILLTLSLVPLLFRSSEVLAGEQQWIEVRSPNFSVITDGGDRRGREVATRFEQMRAAFGTLMTRATVNIPVPLQIVAFRNTKEMRQVAPIFRGKPTQLAGLFQGGQDRSFIMLDLSVEDPWTTVFHEYAHQLLNGNMQAVTDPWFDEGFAEYFSSIEVDGKEARVGKIPREDYLILQQVGTMKVADLFKVQHYSEAYNATGSARTTFYVQSGMLVHYIYDNQLLPKVSTYFDLKLNKHVSVEDAIQQAFGMSAMQMDKALQNYMRVGQYKYYPIPVSRNISEKSYTVLPISAEDAGTVLADIHLHSPDYQERAVAEFEEILKSNPNNAAANRGLGYAYLQKRDLEHAGEYFKRASELDSKDPRVHYYNALLMTRENGFSPASDIARVRNELEISINLDPNFADSYGLLAFAYLNSGDPAKALEMMTKALKIDPRNESYRLNLASIYVASRQPDKAIVVLQSLQNSNNPEIGMRAASMLGNLRRFEQPEVNAEEAEISTPSVALVRRESEKPFSPPGPAATPSATAPGTKWGPPIFLQGTVTSIDCSAEPTAILNVSSKSKAVKLKIADKSHVILIGADQFSCSWTNKKVAVNYRQSDTGETNVVSLELQ